MIASRNLAHSPNIDLPSRVTVGAKAQPLVITTKVRLKAKRATVTCSC